VPDPTLSLAPRPAVPTSPGPTGAVDSSAPVTHAPAVRTSAIAGRAALVATGTAAAALLALLPAALAPPAAVSPAGVSAAGVSAAGVSAAPGLATTPPTAAVTSALAVGHTAATPAGAAATADLPTVTAAVAPVAVRTPVAAVRSSAMENALSKLGARYRYGAAGPNAFDCSGLVYWSYRREGVALPRTSRAMSQIGTPVAKGNLQPGDLVFFYRPVSHVAIYIGNGQVVHASTYRSPVKIASLKGMPFTTARRV
jgi:peptidoglycan DL-endopeptidase CwlO